MTPNLDTNAQAAHDTLISVGSATAALNAQLSAAIITLNSLGANDSKAKLQALQDAMAPKLQAVIDAAATYNEVGGL